MSVKALGLAVSVISGEVDGAGVGSKGVAGTPNVLRGLVGAVLCRLRGDFALERVEVVDMMDLVGEAGSESTSASVGAILPTTD